MLARTTFFARPAWRAAGKGLLATLCAACAQRDVPAEDVMETGDTTGEPAATGTTEASEPATSATPPGSTGGDAEPGTGGMDGPDPPLGPDPRCGNGAIDPGEGCDDGNTLHGDGCLPDCTLGVGVALAPVWTQPAPAWAHDMALIDRASIGAAADALVVGGGGEDTGPVRLELAPLGHGGPAPWSQIVWDQRTLAAMAIAGDGDIVAAGFHLPGAPPESQTIWLARFSPTGVLRWSHSNVLGSWSEHHDVVPSPNGDIIMNFGAWLRVLDPAGTERWTVPAYDCVTVDDHGRIYAAGTRFVGDYHEYVVVHAFDANGGIRWQSELNVANRDTDVPRVAVTPAGTLFVVMENREEAGERRSIASAAAFDTDGALRWWREMPLTDDADRHTPRFVVAAPRDGFFVAWEHHVESGSSSELLRYNAEGTPLYAVELSRGLQKFTRGPDGRYYSLEISWSSKDPAVVVVPHLP